MQRRDVILPAVIILLFGSACFCFNDDGAQQESPESNKASARPSGSHPEIISDGPFLVARPEVTEAPVPARFEAGLPTTARGFEDRDSYPPLSQFEAWVCGGSKGARTKLVDAVATAAEDETLTEDVSNRYRRLIRYCEDPSLCPWLQNVLDSDIPKDAKTVFWHGLSGCHEPSVLESFDHPNAPLAALVDWYFDQHGAEALPAHPRLEAALIERVQSDNRYEARKAGVLLERLEPDAAVALAKSVRQELDDPRQKALMGIGLGDFGDHREAAALYAASCEELDGETMCRERPALPSALESDGEDAMPLAERATSYGFDAVAFLDEHPERQDELEGHLRRCPDDKAKTNWVRARCLAQLAALDRSAATKVARRHVDARGELGSLARTLVAFPKRGALRRQALEWGLVPEETPASVPAGSTAAANTVEALMERNGRVSVFDTETGMFPNQHDALLARLATMAGEDLDGVFFVEEPPDPEIDGFDGGQYLLHAFADGKRYSVSAQNLGDWYDVEAVLGLLNALLIERESEIRVVALETSDQMSRVAAGPRKSLLAAQKQGLLSFSAANSGAQAGKEFEDRVYEHFRK